MKAFSFKLILCFFALIIFFLGSCNKDNDAPKELQPVLPAVEYSYNIPSDIPMDQFINPTALKELDDITDSKATLGRVLFYDQKLSFRNNISCASCHKQENGFSDPRKFSVGFDGRLTSRQAPALVNLVTQSSYFWDSRVSNLQDMVLQPVVNHIEMGLENVADLEHKLTKVSYYPQLFQKAYGSTEITKERIAEAMTQFLCSIVTHDTKFKPKTFDVSMLTAQEVKGMNIFQGKGLCISCHGGQNLRGWDGSDQANIGLDMVYADEGLGTTQPNSSGVFKVPSLYNIALTAPYMHDGRFKTLRDVVDHYSDNIQRHPNLDFRFLGWNGEPTISEPGVDLTESEKVDLIAFLQTLTDEKLVKDPRFSDPFK